MRASNDFLLALAAKIAEIREECYCADTMEKLEELEGHLIQAATT